MKIIFLLALLANIVFFLWEMSSPSPLNLEEDSSAPNQILLQSELPKDKVKTSLADATKKIDNVTNTYQTIASKEKIEQRIQKVKPAEKAGTSLVTAANKTKDATKDEITMATKERIKESIQKGVRLTEKADLGTDKKRIDGAATKAKDTIATKEKVGKPAPKESKLAEAVKPKKNELVKKKTLEKQKEERVSQIKKDKVTTGAMAISSNSYCYQVGPFKNKDALNAWRKENKINPASLSLFEKDENDSKQYMVYYPAAENKVGADKNVEKLNALGITDLWLFTKGEFKGAISLGLFDREATAELKIEEYAKMELSVEVRPFYTKQPALYLKISTRKENFKQVVSLSDGQMIVECEKSQKRL